MFGIFVSCEWFCRILIPASDSGLSKDFLNFIWSQCFKFLFFFLIYKLYKQINGLVKGYRLVQLLQIYLCATTKKSGCRIARLICNIYFTEDILRYFYFLRTSNMLICFYNISIINMKISLLLLNAKLKRSFIFIC